MKARLQPRCAYSDRGTLPGVAQQESELQQPADHDRYEHVRKYRIADADVRRDRAAEIAGPEDRLEYRGARQDGNASASSTGAASRLIARRPYA